MRVGSGRQQPLEERAVALEGGAQVVGVDVLAAIPLTLQLEALSPLAILNRGYALVFDSAGMLLKDAERVKPGDEISARLAIYHPQTMLRESATLR